MSRSPSRGPANNGVHTVRRNPNGGLSEEIHESLETALEAAKGNLEIARWILDHKELWVRKRRRPVRRGQRR